MSARSGYELLHKVLIPTHKKYQSRQEKLKKIIKDSSIPLQERVQAMVDLDKMPVFSRKCRQRRRCSLTFRARAVNRLTGLNRVSMREMIHKNQLIGFTKASW